MEIVIVALIVSLALNLKQWLDIRDLRWLVDESIKNTKEAMSLNKLRKALYEKNTT